MLKNTSDDLPSSSRQMWAQKRRIMEAQKVYFRPDGVRSSWRSRVFSIGLTMFDHGVRWMQLHHRGRGNALNIELVSHCVPLSNLPRPFDGYRILHLSDTHLDCLPELARIVPDLLAGVEVDLLALTGAMWMI